MIKINPRSINDLLALHHAGVPVTLTSHPGNASLYKLVLWTCGIPEHLWDVTCAKADANNWPMHRLVAGEAHLLVTDELHAKICKETSRECRFVTAYQFTREGERLGRYHVRTMQQCFPNVISSCSRLLLSERERVIDLFTFLAETRRKEVFARHIGPDGIMRPAHENALCASRIVDSFVQVLTELDHLLFSDESLEPMGGYCYDGVMVPLATMLVQYWKTGRVDRYDISGPDMIHYATTPAHQAALTAMIIHLQKWNPTLVPRNFIVQMFPGTNARVGHVRGHVSEEIMQRKVMALRCYNNLEKKERKSLWEVAKSDESYWPATITPNTDHYFSQYDLIALEAELVVDDFWKDMPIDQMRTTLLQANGLLRIK